MKDISVYIAQCKFGWYDECQTIIVYAGTSLIDAESAIKGFKPSYGEEVRFGWIEEWMDGKYVQQLEIIS